MSLFKIAKILDKKISTLHIEPNLCTVNISPKSSCHSCVDGCPTDSIFIAKRQIDIDDDCIECGLCSTVCPVSAIFLERPSIKHTLEETARKCKNQDHVFLQCKKQNSKLSPTKAVTVPCLGAIPREGWLTLLNNYENLSIYHCEDSCQHCEIATGYDVWQKELLAAEEMSGVNIPITTTVKQNKRPAQYDENRRELFSLFGSEVMSTNKLILKEMIGEAKVSSYEEKLQEDSASKIRKEWETVSASLMEKLTKEAVQPFMRKRKLLLENVKSDAQLQERCDIRLPSITPECNFCGACSLLCPTGALLQEVVNGQSAITLHPFKCVDCHLCEEICYSENIKLNPVPNKQLFSETVVLTAE